MHLTDVALVVLLVDEADDDGFVVVQPLIVGSAVMYLNDVENIHLMIDELLQTIDINIIEVDDDEVPDDPDIVLALVDDERDDAELFPIFFVHLYI